MDMFDLRQAIERGYQFPVIARLLLRTEIEVRNKAAELRVEASSPRAGEIGFAAIYWTARRPRSRAW
jgi:hypothetical protein